MIKRPYFLLSVIAISLLSSCEFVGGIFQAGYYLGIVAVIGVLLVIFGLFYYIKREPISK